MKANPSEKRERNESDGGEDEQNESEYEDPVRWHLELALDHAENETTTFHLRQALQLVEFDV